MTKKEERKMTVNNYLKMDKREISRIINKGGDKRKELNKVVSDFLDTLDLPKIYKNYIADTDFNIIAELYAGLYSEEAVIAFIDNMLV